MTDYRKRLERYIAGDYVAEIWPEDTFGDVKPSDNVKADLRQLLAEGDRMREALIRLRDCDWVITPLDRMDAVRDIARQALTGKDTQTPNKP